MSTILEARSRRAGVEGLGVVNTGRVKWIYQPLNFQFHNSLTSHRDLGEGWERNVHFLKAIDILILTTELLPLHQYLGPCKPFILQAE